jgi:hypothetical protein
MIDNQIHSKKDVHAARSDIIKKLNKQISISVDFKKHGEVAIFENIAKPDLPDHMDKELMTKGRVRASKVYKSDSILGKLFREVDKHLILDEFLKNDFEISILRTYPLH